MRFETIDYVEDGLVGWLTLSRPEALNALSSEMLLEIERILDGMSGSVRVLVITGKGRAFCAGADLHSVGRSLDGSLDLPRFIKNCQGLFARLRALPFPVIAGINGAAMGGGLELALSADIIVASDTALIGDGHANFGVIPGAGSCAILPRIVGPVVAKYLQFTGSTMNADELRQAGLVAKVWSADDFEARLRALAASIAEKSPLALAHMKRLSNASADQSVESVLDLEMEANTVHVTSQDMREGLAAFAEKRRPVFKGI
ncbi:enoyl-CoA hydratase/isomerase family protein [Aliihoeflea sp. 2WW]|uniref:enoyl-CoA hydratase/isomerase family protein n=1 Tax=Aliihoeflea sp. 2WW TaxID=1381123 RepID=UPI000467422B|nr:enoyl-CoA hydratase/isomerase family protein [Aliihoeflea sp. 2WW]